MANVAYIHTNFTAGELSPRLLGRVDIQKYPNAAETIYNAYPLVHGGVRRRPGTRFQEETKDSTKIARLIPFTFSRTQAFILEVGHLYIRIYTPEGQILSGGLPYEITSPYTEDDLEDLHYAQQADTLLFAHPKYPITSLIRFGNTNWKLGTKRITVPPYDELGEFPITNLTLSGTAGAITATVIGDTFYQSDIGRQIKVGAGVGTITGIAVGHTSVNVTVVDAFPSVGPHASGSWSITESPKTTMAASAKEPLNATVTLTAGNDAFKNNGQISHIGNFITINDGVIEITAISTEQQATGIIRKVLSTANTAQSGAWTMNSPIWTSVLGYPRAIALHAQRLFAGGSDGFPNRISASQIGDRFNFVQGVDDADGFTYAIDGEYNSIEHLSTLNELIPLTYGNGYSLAGGPEKPITPTTPQLKKETSFGSSTVRPINVGDELIYVQRGFKKVRAMGYTIQKEGYLSDDISILSEHLTKRGIYEVSTSSEPDSLVWMVRGDGALITMAIDRSQSVVGLSRNFTQGIFESVATIPNEDVDQTWVIVKRKVNGQWKRYVEVFEEGLNTDSCITGNVSFVDIQSISWSNGVVTVEHDAHAFTTGDEVKITNVVGFLINDEADEIETDTYNGIVEITVVDGTHFTYPLTENPGEAIQMGSVLYGKTTNWGGLTHLIGQEVDIVADGVVQQSQTVDNSGNVALSEAAYQVEIGLHYSTRVKLLTPAINAPTGTAQGSAMSTHEVTLRLYKSIGGKINDKPIPFRKFGNQVLNKPLLPFTGDVRLSQIGWSRGTENILIEQDQPLPFQLLAVIRKMAING